MRSKLLCGLAGARWPGVPAGLSMGNWPKAPKKRPTGTGVPRQNGRLAAPTTEGRSLLETPMLPVDDTGATGAE